GVEVDVDAGDAGDLEDLIAHGRDAVLAGHPGHGEGGGAGHGSPRDACDQERTRRATASEASLSLASASGPPDCAACSTQCARCSSSRPSATAWSALVTADTWVRMSMQYLSSSSIRAMPRTWPSMRRIRLA